MTSTTSVRTVFVDTRLFVVSGFLAGFDFFVSCCIESQPVDDLIGGDMLLGDSVDEWVNGHARSGVVAAPEVRG
jgi:hypothetical protein